MILQSQIHDTDLLIGRILSINLGIADHDGNLFSDIFCGERDRSNSLAAVAGSHQCPLWDSRPQDQDKSLIIGKNAEGVLESVICKYGDEETDYCKVLFRYTTRGLERQWREHIFDGLQEFVCQTAWYENSVQGHRIEQPPLDEVFPGKKGGDLFLNWVEYPLRCQVWRFTPVQFFPFQEAKWEPLTWGAPDAETKGVLVIIKGGNFPAFVSGKTYDILYKNSPGNIIL